MQGSTGGCIKANVFIAYSACSFHHTWSSAADLSLHFSCKEAAEHQGSACAVFLESQEGINRYCEHLLNLCSMLGGCLRWCDKMGKLIELSDVELA